MEFKQKGPGYVRKLAICIIQNCLAYEAILTTLKRCLFGSKLKNHDHLMVWSHLKNMKVTQESKAHLQILCVFGWIFGYTRKIMIDQWPLKSPCFGQTLKFRCQDQNKSATWRKSCLHWKTLTCNQYHKGHAKYHSWCRGMRKIDTHTHMYTQVGPRNQGTTATKMIGEGTQCLTLISITLNYKDI